MSDFASLREIVRQILTDTWPPLPEYASHRPLPPEPGPLLRLAEELGWRELEEDAAGFGFTAVVLEQLGSALGPGELTTGVALGPLLDAFTEDPSAHGAFAVSWAATDWRREAGAPVLEGDGERLRLTGTVPWVLGAAPEARLLVLADHGGRPAALLLPLDSEHTRLEQVDGSDPTRVFAHWTADALPVAPARVVARDAAAEALASRARERVDLGLALDSLGVAKAALELTLAFAKVREQFDAPIGSFQAVKHRCVDMFVRVQCAEALIEEAVRRFGSGGPEAGLQAKAAACEAAAEVTRSALQTHGAIGYTWEHPCHLLVRRAKLNQALGTPADEARRTVGASLTRALTTFPDGAAPAAGSREGSHARLQHG